MPGTALRRVYQQWHLCRAESSWKEPSTAACSCLGTTACLQALCKVLCLCWKPGILKIGCLNPVLFVLACWIVIATANQDLFLLHPGLCKAPVLLWSFMWKKTLSQESAKGICLKLCFLSSSASKGVAPCTFSLENGAVGTKSCHLLPR